ncbi:MAG: hypothetical protein AAFV80_23415 [Bacteroidota bacterium]
MTIEIENLEWLYLRNIAAFLIIIEISACFWILAIIPPPLAQFCRLSDERITGPAMWNGAAIRQTDFRRAERTVSHAT